MGQIFPTIVFLAVVVWYVRSNSGRPVVQIYTLIVASYLNLFPALDFLFSSGLEMESFLRLQILVMGFFEIPLLLLMHRLERPSLQGLAVSDFGSMRLSPWLPAILGLVLLIFWHVALGYDLFFRRLGHDALQLQSAEVPPLLLYGYRGAVETSFFVIIFLFSTLRMVDSATPCFARYRLLLGGYLATFFVFFAANSRMQFLLLLLCVICTQPKVADFFLRRIKLLPLAALGAVLVIGITLLREVYFEQNDRLEGDELVQLLRAVGWLISARLDSVVILNRLVEEGFNPFGFEWSGVLHVVNFYISFFIDPQAYAAVKESLVTSPSVEIVNRLLSATAVDFPKSMILDTFLSFGVLGLLGTALLLGKAVSWIQKRILAFRHFDPAFLIAIYTLPMLLEFEKEFLGFFFAFLKWTPFLALVAYLRPKRVEDSSLGRT